MSILSKLRKPAPTTTIGPGIPLHLGEPLTWDHPHARVAKADFVAAYRYLPGGLKSYGATLVAAGSLADDRSPLVRDNPRRFRKPTRAERQPAPEPATEEPAASLADQAQGDQPDG